LSDTRLHVLQLLQTGKTQKPVAQTFKTRLRVTGDHYVDKPSATGQPTRPTQPFILPGSINEY